VNTVRTRKKRIPRLAFTSVRNIGWHVSYRDPATGLPRKHRFGMVDKARAETMYFDWVAAHLRGETKTAKMQETNRKLAKRLGARTVNSVAVSANITPGCLLEIASGLLTYEESRIRPADGPRIQNTITSKQYNSRKQFTEEFLQYVNDRYGKGAVGRLKLADLTMKDIESFNMMLVENDFSDSQIRKRMQLVKAIIDRAGRPEYGHQVLTWNWDSRDPHHGRPDQKITLPTLTQLKLVLHNCDIARTAQVWLAIGCGFGQRDLSALRVGDIDKDAYDLRRGKTGVERFGQTPKLVWASLQRYLADTPRPDGELMFVTQRGKPLVHNYSDSIGLWWSRLRQSLDVAGDGLNGFYSLRHLGATEYGSRPGCSIGDMRAWLGHSVSSAVADRYMKPISPQVRPVVEWVRKSLQSVRADISLPH
jgi:integrase